MGYYTSYNLSWEDPEGTFDPTEKFTEYDVSPEDIAEGKLSEVKWYDCLDDMTGLSKQWPKVLFTLMGEGEESGDIWRAYFRNTKFQVVKAKVSFDDPDLEKLR